MNERIQELSKEAFEYALSQHPGSDEFQPIWTEKFAELIVRECCNMFVELRTRPADLAVLDVKKHFGVEE